MAEKALPKGSLVLVTGINGYIGSHVADQLLSLGYRVRGTARDSTKLAAILKRLRQRNAAAEVEGLVVPDMQTAGAFKEAVKGADGVVHLASDLSFNPDPNVTVTATVEGLRNALTAASSVPSVQRFVYTSSSIAAVKPTPNKQFQVDSNSWNEEDLKLAWAPPPYEPSRAFSVYGASKVASERLAWDFTKAVKFDFNTVLPNMNVGRILDPSQSASTAGWVKGLYDGDEGASQILQGFPPQYYIDVEDCALIHVAALLEPDVKDERLFAFARPFNYHDLMETLKQIDPSRTQYPPALNDNRDLSKVANGRALELLKRYGRTDFKDLEISLKEQLLA
ncbi:hypothetical protein M409DRAFT_28531 [Zasmidium cellare ATCC 36951]|uniref:NAD-dependent epimerase/dehydratase domain-containing protein n=1 Tax=Zasmidium cellare ATCC 36951 TaxID=1080233 RepID=A0A6A6C202_ZASCE|nr:uncharacterized protein M409DRAFT_28531 [Zasmidium cellare ATCC 36951]KAF2160923.1 hypothetical protein M409DRAFT_28531 [Zasmidium cellare ATCC 36951]